MTEKQERRQGWNVIVYPCESFNAKFHTENSCLDNEVETYREYFYQISDYDSTDEHRKWNEFRTYFQRKY